MASPLPPDSPSGRTPPRTDHGHSHPHGYAHGHSHSHGHDHGTAGRPHRGAGHGPASGKDAGAGLGIAFWLIGVFTIVEAAGGYWSGSLAVLADAGHMFVDTLALALAYAAHRLAHRPASEARSFGHSRLREWALGGVTRDLLLQVDRCALVSH